MKIWYFLESFVHNWNHRNNPNLCFIGFSLILKQQSGWRAFDNHFNRGKAMKDIMMPRAIVSVRNKENKKAIRLNETKINIAFSFLKIVVETKTGSRKPEVSEKDWLEYNLQFHLHISIWYCTSIPEVNGPTMIVHKNNYRGNSYRRDKYNRHYSGDKIRKAKLCCRFFFEFRQESLET